MTSVFFIIILGLGIIFYILLIKKKPENGVVKNYYYRRFLRNKLQMENYIEEIKNLISTYNCGKNLFNENITVEQYLSDLLLLYNSSYTDFNINVLKKKKLKDKHKKYYAKMLTKQSEKLYFVESDLIKMAEKFKV